VSVQLINPGFTGKTRLPSLTEIPDKKSER
jgi:hypothetical protein